MHAPAVSVVMAVRNGQRYAAAALRSVLEQTLADIECVIVDDGSTDATVQVLSDTAGGDPRARILRGAGVGLVDALNLACANAAGALLARFDQDDVCLPQRLAQQAAFLRANPGHAAVGGAIELVDDEDRLFGRVRFPTGAAAIRRTLRRRNCFAHSAMMIRREALAAAGGFRRALFPSEDYDLWLRLSEGAPLANLPQAAIRYRVHREQASQSLAAGQAVSTLAARVCAARRLARVDEGLGETPVGRDWLLAAGVSAARIDAAIVDHLVTWGETLALAGAVEGSDAYFETAARHAPDARILRAAIARRDWTRTKTCLRGRDVRGALGALAQTVAAQPGLVVSRVAGKAWDALKSGGG